jgi:non-heme chloroperoxidase
MPYLTVGKENDEPMAIYYEDHGSGKPVVLIHGFPFSGRAWERQRPALLQAGYRVISYDRRGFGESSQPSGGYDYDTFAADLDALLTKLDLQEAVLVGHSMGTGEITRYLGTKGSERVRKAVLISALPPYLLKTSDNPAGVDQAVFDDIQRAIAKDRFVYLTQFINDFFNVDENLGKRVSQEALQGHWIVAVQASPEGTYQCVSAWLTDFRTDLSTIDVPVLVIHGDADRILPYNATAKFLPDLLQNCRLVTLKGAPHGIPWTHSDIVNEELLTFLGS